MTRAADGTVEAVVKVGGGLLGRGAALERVAGALAAAGRRHRLVVVPGGGPFADAVRELNRRIKLSDDAAHWMAILGMDQYAHALAARIAGATLVEEAGQIAAGLDAGRIPVLAPYRWLREADPLPHSWDVTSDSIAAWIAGALAAPRLVLVKPARGGDPKKLVDPYFARALARWVEPIVLAADDIDRLEDALHERGGQHLHGER